MQVGDVPYTLNGKRVEVPVKKVGVSFLVPDRRDLPNLGPHRVGAGSLRSLATEVLITRARFNLDLEWGFIGFIQHGYSSEPRGTGRVYWVTRNPSRRIGEGVGKPGTWYGGKEFCMCEP
jgi:hypothetical protein